MIRNCKTHGSTEFVIDSTKRERCKACRVDAVKRRRRKVKTMAIEYKGGKCEKCGYNKYPEVLEFHHIDPTQKDFQISSNTHNKSWDAVKTELDKCLMLCANCHRELHVELRL